MGAGKNLEEAMKPVYFIANGRKIAIVAATQIERSLNYTKEAATDQPGVLKTLNPEKFLSVIGVSTREVTQPFWTHGRNRNSISLVSV